MAGPDDLAVGLLHCEYEVDGSFDHRPHGVEEPTVAGEQPVVPHTSGDIAAHIGVDLGVFDAVSEVVVVPPAVAMLGVD